MERDKGDRGRIFREVQDVQPTDFAPKERFGRDDSS